MKRVYASFNQPLVYHARNLLAAQGIAVELRNAALSSGLGELPATETELWVEDADERRAAQVLAEQPAGPDWRCACGEALGPQFSHCWRCGAERR